MPSSLFNPDQDISTNSKKAKRILCGRFSRISTKLPRIPLRRQKLPKVVGKPQNSSSYPTAGLPEAAVFYVIILSGDFTTQAAKATSLIASLKWQLKRFLLWVFIMRLMLIAQWQKNNKWHIEMAFCLTPSRDLPSAQLNKMATIAVPNINHSSYINGCFSPSLS